MTPRRFRVAIVVTHPIQYYAPWYRALARVVDLEVFFCHRQTSEGQAAAGFGVAFDWDVPLLDGYQHRFLTNVSRRPDVGTFFGCNTPELGGLIERGGFDAVIVHGWSTQSYWQAIRACWRTKTPVLVRGDSTLNMARPGWWRAVKTPIFRAFIPRLDGYLIVGSRSREYLQRYGADPARCFAAPHAVDNAFFAAAAERLRPSRVELRRAFGLPPDAFVPLFVGRFVERKRPDLFVDAVTRAAGGRRVVGLMVGDGPDHSAIEASIRAGNAPVKLCGFLNQGEIARAYVAADLLVVPSTWETWGLVVNEAMASGLPCLVTEGVACAGDLVVPGESGSVTPVGDVVAMSTAIGRLADNPATRLALADGARRRVAHFDIDAAVNGTLRALAALARPERATSATPADGPARHLA
jgi:glycosyltransferase involved in cell wall biosynthesis